MIELMECVDAGEKMEYEKEIPVLLNIMIEEIKAQSDLSLAEENDLQVNIRNCNSISICSNSVNFYRNRASERSILLFVESESENLNFESDEILVSRVLGNMIKNGIEASESGNSVSVSCALKNDKVLFTVHNSGFITLSVQQQIFQRSFSTKGKGRGMGTYSMRLLTGRYLKGEISFNSTERDGTDFIAEFPLIYIR
jgi:signal transduction histidine kinase